MATGEMKRIDSGGTEAQQEDLLRLQTVFPAVVTEGATGLSVDVDGLLALLGVSTDDAQTATGERYGLTWSGRRRALQHSLTPSLGTLRPVPDHSVGWHTTQNLMIEGDNLEALKLLQKSYAGRVKMIYIDPPYNTGSDLVYQDDFEDSIKQYLELTGQTAGGAVLTTNVESSGRFHTKWLNMMLPRLRVARTLLKDDGVIFISIGGQELANLKLVCDQVFGEENFIAYICRVAKVTSNLGEHIAPSTDFVLVYARSIENVGAFHEMLDEQYAARFKGEDERGQFNIVGLYQVSLSPGKNQRYWIECPDGSLAIPPGSSLPPNEVEGSLAPILSQVDKGWRWSLNKYQTEKDDLLVFKQTSTSPLRTPSGGRSPWNVYSKFYLEDRLAAGLRPRDFMTGVENEKGTKELGELDLGKVFDFPKPTELIKRFLHWVQDPTAIVLDFFAGSGTTGHAVMAQNAADGGSRRYILVQLPELVDEESAAAQAGYSNIAEITKERLRRAGVKTKAENPTYEGDLGFRVFKLESSNLQAWDPDPSDLKEALLQNAEHVKSDRTEQDLLYELLLRLGLDLCVRIEERKIAGKTVYAVGDGVLIACLNKTIHPGEVEDLAGGIVSWHEELGAEGDSQCVFRDSAFTDTVVKTNVATILREGGIKEVRSL